MVNLRRELSALFLFLVSAWLGLAACGRTPSEMSTLSLTVTTGALKLAPGQSSTLGVQVATTAVLKSSVQLTSVGEGSSDLPPGLSVAFEPAELTVAPSAMAQLRIAALPTAAVGTYSLIITARSDEYEQSARLKVTLSGAGQGWQRQVGSPGSEVLSSLAIDSTGSVCAAGQTTGSIGGRPNAGQFDGYLLKYKPSGALFWAQTLATASSDVITAIAVDAADNIYAAGYTYGAFPGSMNAGKADGFVAKYNASGALLWLRQLGSSEIDQLTALAVDPTGGVVAVGATEGGFGLLMNRGPLGTSDVVVIKLTADGQQVYAQQLGTDMNERPTGIAVDATGAAYVVGSTQGAFPGATALGGYDLFVFKLMADGSLGWMRQEGTPYDDQLSAALIDSKGALTAVGWTRGAFGGQTQSGGQDALLLSYDPSGARQLTRQFGTSYNDVLNGLTRVGDTLYAVGSTRGAFPDQIPSGSADIFTVRFAADGGVAWLTQLGTDQSDSGNGIAATATTLYLGGTTFGTFDGQILQGDSDGIIVQLLGAASAQGY
jgi:hypothetical protein